MNCITHPELQRKLCLVDHPVWCVDVQVQAAAVVCMDAQAQVLIHVICINLCLHGDGFELFKVRRHL